MGGGPEARSTGTLAGLAPALVVAAQRRIAFLIARALDGGGGMMSVMRAVVGLTCLRAYSGWCRRGKAVGSLIGRIDSLYSMK